MRKLHSFPTANYQAVKVKGEVDTKRLSTASSTQPKSDQKRDVDVVDFVGPNNTKPLMDSKNIAWTDNPKTSCLCWPTDATLNTSPEWMCCKVFCCETITIAFILGLFNVIAFCAHLTFTIVVIGVSFSVNEETGKARDWVLLPVYRTMINLKQSDVSPSMSEGATSQTSFDASMLIPVYAIDEDDGLIQINLTLFTIFFFALSALAHFIVFVISINSNIYLWWIARCRQPLRWIEYSFSAAIMIVPIAFFCGIRSYEQLVCIFFLIMITMFFGWVTEALSRPVEIADGPNNIKRCTQWQIGADDRSLVLRYRWTAPLQRLGPWFLGWIPYCVAWYIIIINYQYSVDKSDGDGKPPDWVIILVIGQLAIFTLFAVVQLFQQASDYGCKHYWVGELAYIVLSATAKIMLGGILLANIFLSTNEETRRLINGPKSN